MTTTSLPLVKGDKVGSETDYRDALPVNMYVVPKQILDSAGYMIQNYGITGVSVASGACRGGFYNDRQQSHFRVHGNDFIEIDELGAITVLGTVTGYQPQTNTAPPVTLDYSFNTQGILANGIFYLYDPINLFRVYPDIDVGTPIDFVWVDGYYFFTDGEYLYHSLAANEEAIDPLDFGVPQFMPDSAKALGITQDDKVIVWGRYSTEYFSNDASANFAFSRIQSRQVKVGIVATHLKAESGSNWYFVGGGRRESLSVHLLGVGTTTKIATREVEKILATYDESELVNAHMESYTIDAISFLKIHLPRETLLFNITIAESIGFQYAWSILKSDIYGTDPDRATYSVYDPRNGEWMVGDINDGNIGTMDDMVSTQYGNVIEWLLFTPFIDLNSQSIDEVSFETISGFTASNDATVFLSLTYDGVFYGQEKTVEYGMINEYGKRFIARRLGYVRDIFSLKMKGASRSRMAFARGMIKHG